MSDVKYIIILGPNTEQLKHLPRYTSYCSIYITANVIRDPFILEKREKGEGEGRIDISPLIHPSSRKPSSLSSTPLSLKANPPLMLRVTAYNRKYITSY